jgi:TP53 regulating kinase-like protein
MSGSEGIIQGAEAIITQENGMIVKSRPVKGYRHPRIDYELRTDRAKHEARLLAKAKAAGVHVPDATLTDTTTLRMTMAPGKPVKDQLDQDPLIAHQIGRAIAKLHAANIIHGDLTTSNMCYDPATHQLTLIDFGLAFASQREEDKAVDLHVLKQSIMSKHHRVLAMAVRHLLAGYREYAEAENVIARLRKVEARGRNKGS